MSERKKTPKNSYAPLIQKYNEILTQYADILPASSILGSWNGAAENIANNPTIQNQRVKAISSLPVELTKEDIGNYLRKPYSSEIPLRQTAQILKTTAYPFYKIIKTAQDIPIYRYYAKPCFVTDEEAKSEKFMRTAKLVDKINKTLRPESIAHKIAGQALTMGKVFYTLRYDVDKVHNKVNHAFLQQLPEDRCFIIGHNNISGYTVSFDMMYFTQPGCDWRQYGDLFEPYIYDFNRIFEKPEGKQKFVYASRDGITVKDKYGEKTKTVYPSRVNAEGYGNPKIWMQNGRFAYYVSLPINRVWTFEIDDTNPAAISAFSGLLLTYSQQADYEAAQLSLLLSPLIKIFTGEIPYKDNTTADDMFSMSLGARTMFSRDFDNKMNEANTGGTAFYTAPVNNIKSHDFAESANANKISETFNKYGMEKAGLAGLIPVTDDVKAAQVDASEKIENRFVTATIYPQFCRMMNNLYTELNIGEWEFVMFGTIFDESTMRENLTKALSNGDIAAYIKLAALDGESWIDKLCELRLAKASGITELLTPPPTAYTQSNGDSGRPQSTDISESKEKSIDMGYSDM